MSLYELTKLTDEQFEARVASGELRPEIERQQRRARWQSATECDAENLTKPDSRNGGGAAAGEFL
jgi:hypothetical protein